MFLLNINKDVEKWEFLCIVDGGIYCKIIFEECFIIKWKMFIVYSLVILFLVVYML